MTSSEVVIPASLRFPLPPRGPASSLSLEHLRICYSTWASPRQRLELWIQGSNYRWSSNIIGSRLDFEHRRIHGIQVCGSFRSFFLSRTVDKSVVLVLTSGRVKSGRAAGKILVTILAFQSRVGWLRFQGKVTRERLGRLRRFLTFRSYQRLSIKNFLERGDVTKWTPFRLRFSRHSSVNLLRSCFRSTIRLNGSRRRDFRSTSSENFEWIIFSSILPGKFISILVNDNFVDLWRLNSIVRTVG